MQSNLAIADQVPELYPVESRTFSNELFKRFDEYVRDRKATTIKNYGAYLKQFARWIAAQGIAQPDRNDVIDYKNYLTSTGLAASTQAQYLRAVKQFFKWTDATGLYKNDIAVDINGPKVQSETYRRDALTRQEFESVLNHIDRTTASGKRLYAIAMLAGRRGLRVIEISRLRFKDLSEKDGIEYLEIWGKGHDEADTSRAIDSDTKAAIDDYLTVRGKHELTDPLFVSTSNNSKGEAILPTTISAMLKAALRKAGLDSPRLTAHSFRHLAVTVALECSGDNIQMGKDFARHKDPATTERYNHRNIVKNDAELVQAIQDSYHDNDGTADTRQELHDMINSASPDELARMKAMLKEGRRD